MVTTGNQFITFTELGDEFLGDLKIQAVSYCRELSGGVYNNGYNPHIRVVEIDSNEDVFCFNPGPNHRDIFKAFPNGLKIAGGVRIAGHNNDGDRFKVRLYKE